MQFLKVLKKELDAVEKEKDVFIYDFSLVGPVSPFRLYKNQ